MRQLLLVVALLSGGAIACNGGSPPIKINPAATTLTVPSTVPAGTVGVAYTLTLTATGGNGTYTWTQTGTMPPGLTFTPAPTPSASATISGTPTTYGDYTPSFKVCDTEPTPLCSTSVQVDPQINLDVPIYVGHSVTLSWTASTSTVSGYRVYRSATSGGPYTQISGTSLLAATGYLDSEVVSGATYYYVVTAVDSSNVESAYSNEVVAVIPS